MLLLSKGVCANTFLPTNEVGILEQVSNFLFFFSLSHFLFLFLSRVETPEEAVEDSWSYSVKKNKNGGAHHRCIVARRHLLLLRAPVSSQYKLATSRIATSWIVTLTMLQACIVAMLRCCRPLPWSSRALCSVVSHCRQPLSWSSWVLCSVVTSDIVSPTSCRLPSL